jgi:glutamate dehydrogenase
VEAIEELDNRVDSSCRRDAVDMSRELERGTTWFLRSRAARRRHGQTIDTSRRASKALARGCRRLLDETRARALPTEVADYVAARAWPSRSRHESSAGMRSTRRSNIVEGGARRPQRQVELVAEIYFALGTALQLPWLREMIDGLPEKHWRSLRECDAGRLVRAAATIAGEISARTRDRRARECSRMAPSAIDAR